MTKQAKALMQQALDSLIESAQLLGAMQEKRLWVGYTKTDSMFEGDFYEIIDVKKQIILEAIAHCALPVEPDRQNELAAHMALQGIVKVDCGDYYQWQGDSLQKAITQTKQPCSTK